MPAKTGASHAFAAFTSMVVGTVLSKYIWNHAPSLAEAGTRVSAMLASTAGVELPATASGSLVVVLGLSFLWGVVYHVTRHD